MDGMEIEGDSEPAVALALLKTIMRAEGKEDGVVDAAWILATYGRCLAAVMGEAPEGGDAAEDEEDDEEGADNRA